MKVSSKLLYQTKAAVSILRRRCLFLFVVAGICGTATAAENKEVVCRKVGARAETIATARDQGKSMEEVIASLRNVSGQADDKPIKEAAELLFKRFRQMTPEAAAFEFYMDCLDND